MEDQRAFKSFSGKFSYGLYGLLMNKKHGMTWSQQHLFLHTLAKLLKQIEPIALSTEDSKRKMCQLRS